MTRPCRRRGAAVWTSAVLFALIVVGLAPSALAAGQASSCAPSPLPTAFVEILSPRQGDSVSGPATVRARAQSLLPLSNAELRVNGTVIDRVSLDNTLDASFSFGWDTASTAPGLATLRVSVCGAGAGLAYGEGSVRVDVRRDTASTTTPPTTISGGSTEPVATSTSVARPTTTVATNATTTIARTTTVVEALPAESPAPTTTVAPRARDITLREGAGEDEPSLPGWVGVVVGLSGLAGLGVSMLVRRRPRRTVAEQPVDVVELV